MAWNLVKAPIRNRTHLVTIVLIAVGFAGFRLSGGSFSWNSLSLSHFLATSGAPEAAPPSDSPPEHGSLSSLSAIERAASDNRERIREQLKAKVLGNLETPEPEDLDDGIVVGDSLQDIETIVGLR